MRTNKTEADPSQKLTGHGTEQPGQGDHALCKGAGLDVLSHPFQTLQFCDFVNPLGSVQSPRHKASSF